MRFFRPVRIRYAGDRALASLFISEGRARLGELDAILSLGGITTGARSSVNAHGVRFRVIFADGNPIIEIDVRGVKGSPRVDKRLYVSRPRFTGAAFNFIYAFDRESERLIKKIEGFSCNGIRGMVATSSGDYLYAVGADAPCVLHKISTATNAIIGTVTLTGNYSGALALTDGEDYLVAACAGLTGATNGLSRVRLDDFVEDGFLSFSGLGTANFVVCVGTTAYVSAGGQLRVVNVETMAHTSSINTSSGVGSGAGQAIRNRAGTLLYVPEASISATPADCRVTVVTLPGGSMADLPVVPNYYRQSALLLSPDEGLLYFKGSALAAVDELFRLDLLSSTVTHQQDIGTDPGDFARDPRGKTIYVPGFGIGTGSEVLKFNASTLDPITPSIQTPDIGPISALAFDITLPPRQE